MSDVRTVMIQLRSPSHRSAGQVTTGYYVVEGDRLTMTYEDGEPVYRDPEKTLTYSHALRPGDDVPAIARVLTRQVRRELSGQTEDQEAFGRPIDYPVSSVA